ncbi:MAG: UDP-3-O-(3-hydroxymyristoyl)glucosamine N-acyltransferase [Methylococcales bacterium]|jgi:UDP-3-O-[3-hydroxymyristoyl] glucosamine N-acyltransferase|nr:UDP-3-O-(3-hydroxymyristoyl)glucosamine N-acyltransferase [Methylococcales bacterium]MBT7409298.1 UDP-3-O-(3-hydroxymyristoyl)glucosamine N-acyltransferase [Methylococcales bacterium]
MTRSIKLEDLAKEVGAEVVGNGDCEIQSVATLISAQSGQISFLANKQYRKYLKDTQASAVIISKEFVDDCPCNAVVSSDPYVCYAKIATLLNPKEIKTPGIHSSAVIFDNTSIDPTALIGAGVVIEDGVNIGANVIIGPGCVIKENCIIGDDSHLMANITVYDGCVIGQRAVIQPGAVIGGDGFGLAMDNGQWIKVPQLGIVRIGDDVEVGSNTTIDRGALEDTIIGDGVKLDNMVMIAHNVKVGAHSAMAACSGISGSTEMGKYCTVAGGAGFAGHLKIADQVHVTAMSMITKSIKEKGSYSSGSTIEPTKQWRRNAVRMKQLDDMAKKIQQLEKIVKELQS